MKQILNTLTRQHPSGFWKRMGFNCCFAVFSAVFFFAYVSGWAHVPVKEEVPGLHTAFASEANSIFNNHHAGPHPFSTNLVFVETEVVDETRSDNEHNTPLNDVNIPEPGRAFHTGKSLFLQLKLVNECREKISLFVLHHCWKSFLQ